MPSLSNHMTLLHKLMGPNTWKSWPGSWLNVPVAWEEATQEQRNKLALCLFDEVWVKDKIVVAVKPRAELEPFFRLNYEEFRSRNIEGEIPRCPDLHNNNRRRGIRHRGVARPSLIRA